MELSWIIFGIKATLRAAQAGADLYGEHARDRKVFLPNLDLPPGSNETRLQLFLTKHQDLIHTSKELEAVWDDDRRALKTTNPALIEPAYAVMLQCMAKEHLKKSDDAELESKMLAAGSMVEQWRKDRQPPSAVARMALTLTDIALEFVASDPSILGIGSRGEKLVEAFAGNMANLIPDDVAEFGTESNFADRVLGIFFRAGLGVLSSHAGVVFKDEDIANLVSGVGKPIVDALPETISEQIVYRDVVDALAGPAAEAAFTLLAENTEAYLGKRFASDEAVGAVTTALFESAAKTVQKETIAGVFSDQGLIRLYQAGLGVAMERPQLFIGDSASAKAALFRDLLAGTAGVLQAHPRFKGPIGASLAAMAVEAVGYNAPAILKLDPDEPWEKVAEDALKQITTGLAEALKAPDRKGALEAFSDDQLVELGRVVLAQAAQTPGMLGVGRTEVQAIVAGMAEAMAADDNLLLSGDEWIDIAAVAARKAASNPARLFGLSTETAADALAVTVISSVLKVAGEAWSAEGRKSRPMLFGETLASAVETVVEALAGNVSAVAEKPELIDQFLDKLLTDASANPEKWGSDGLLKVLRTFIGSVMATGALPTDDEIKAVLEAQPG
ncbi:MAG: hypothetical protein PVG78_18920 [Desulfobacterales bacterium]|jgi:hypothetical protein